MIVECLKDWLITAVKLIHKYVLDVVNLHCNVHIAQISSVIADDVFDVSFGLCNDEEAYHFLKKK